jgi:predicted Zn-dependent peptidase
VLKLIRKSVYDFINQPVDKKRFKEACNFINSRDCMDYDSVNGITGSLIRQMLNEKEIRLPEDYAEITNKIDPESIRKLMQKYINPKNEFLAVMKNKDSSPKTKAPLRK